MDGAAVKQGILMRTNILVCIVVIGGFAVTSLLSYQANYGASLQGIEQVSRLASDSIYHRLSAEFAKPVSVSLAMSNDSLLEDLLAQETRRDDAGFVEAVREYLAAYREQFGYDSVFLVSSATGRYYNFEGVDRVLAPGDSENDWYYELLGSDAEHAMNVDNDEAAHDEITMFVNCKILAEGKVLGVVGVGVRVEHLQALFERYREEFDVESFLVDGEGVVQVSADHNGHEGVDYFALHDFTAPQRDDVLEHDPADGASEFWSGEEGAADAGDSSYVVSRYLADLDWHLVVERDAGALVEELRAQLARTVAVIAAIVIVILLIITSVIRSFNRRIVQLTQSVERERRTAFEKATGEMFEGIYELDITHDRPANQAAEEYFESLGAPRGLPFSSSLHIVAEKQIEERFRQGYLDMFAPESVLAAFESGRDALSYECRIRTRDDEYRWMRITARIVFDDADESVRALVYRQDIDAEKRQESRMQLLAMTDEMTGLYTKSATKHLIERRLAENPDETCAFFIFDIDMFKQANDRFGHAFGDTVIESFTGTIRASFRKEDVIGRVGGDEFVAFAAAPSAEWAKRKAQALSRALDRDHSDGGATWHVSASIGIALAPRDGRDFETLYRRADEALYRTKERGRNGFTLSGDA